MKRSYIWLTVAILILMIIFLLNGIRIQNIKRNYQSNWRQYVTVRATGKFRKDSSGKMSVVITVTNHLPYAVEQVRVLVTDLLAQGFFYKSTVIDVYDIPSNNFKSKPAPDCEIGSKLRTTIGYLKCKELNLY